jgi:hypothetical protein
VTKKLDICWCWIKCTRCPHMRAVAIARWLVDPAQRTARILRAPYFNPFASFTSSRPTFQPCGLYCSLRNIACIACYVTLRPWLSPPSRAALHCLGLALVTQRLDANRKTGSPCSPRAWVGREIHSIHSALLSTSRGPVSA